MDYLGCEHLHSGYVYLHDHIEHVDREVGKKEDDHQGHQHFCCLLPLVDEIRSRFMSRSRPAIESYLSFGECLQHILDTDRDKCHGNNLQENNPLLP